MSPLPDRLSPSDVQRRILAISRDARLSKTEKGRRRQRVLSHQFRRRQRSEGAHFVRRQNAQRDEPSHSAVVHPRTGSRMLGCAHYPRNCKLRARCCGVWVVCRLCHDEHHAIDHAMPRFETEEVLCMLCKEVQPVAAACRKCKQRFARYFCAKCKFYDNTPGKAIYHCDKCKICRVGKGIGHDNFHCDNCDVCVSRGFAKTHRCLKKSLDANCAICGHYLSTSTKPVVFMRCGHTMHAHCFDVYTAEHYVCPLCHKALTNMRPYYNQLDQALKREVMPPEHCNTMAEILCHDCEKRSNTPFHFVYLKCKIANCGSYNTRLIRTFKKTDAAAGGVSSSSSPGAGPSDAPYEDDDDDDDDGDGDGDNDDDKSYDSSYDEDDDDVEMSSSDSDSFMEEN